MLNHVRNHSIKNMPASMPAGSTYNTLSLPQFQFWQPVYFNKDDSSFPSNATKEKRRFAGTSKNCWA